jgi:hypothetical protein
LSLENATRATEERREGRGGRGGEEERVSKHDESKMMRTHVDE